MIFLGGSKIMLEKSCLSGSSFWCQTQTKNFKLGAPGLWKVVVVFIDLWYHMKLRKPSPCVGKPLEKKYLPEGIKKPAVVPPG